MKTIKVKVYSYDELSEEVQEKVLNSFRNDPFAVDLVMFEEGMQEDLKAIGWSDVQPSYSLSCCQGDGLSFTGYLDIEYFLNNIYSKKLANYKKRGLKFILKTLFN